MESDNSFEKLIERALFDPDSLTQLHRRIYLFQLWSLGNTFDAQDAAQDTLMTFLQKHTEVRDRSCLKAWLMRVAHNKAMDRLRRKHPDLSLDEIDNPDESPLCEWLASTSIYDMPEALLEWQEFHPLVMAALEELPVKHRSCLILRFVQGLNTEEIAQLHGLCTEQIRRILRSAKTQFAVAYMRLVSEQQKKERGQDS